jgi:hypothetical protein
MKATVAVMFPRAILALIVPCSSQFELINKNNFINSNQRKS